MIRRLQLYREAGNVFYSLEIRWHNCFNTNTVPLSQEQRLYRTQITIWPQLQPCQISSRPIALYGVVVAYCQQKLGNLQNDWKQKSISKPLNTRVFRIWEPNVYRELCVCATTYQRQRLNLKALLLETQTSRRTSSTDLRKITIDLWTSLRTDNLCDEWQFVTLLYWTKKSRRDELIAC